VSGEDSRAYLVEEIQLFPDPEPVRNLQLAPTQVGRDLMMRWPFGGSGHGGRGGLSPGPGQGLGLSQVWLGLLDALCLSSRVQCL
jgi:hypothetical protein